MLDNVVFYWAGEVPRIAELAICSALVKFPEARVHLWLDSDQGFESRLPEGLQWVSEHVRVQIHVFSLEGILIMRGFRPFHPLRNVTERLTHLASNLFSSRLSKSKFAARLSKTSRLVRIIFGSYHPIFGWFRPGLLVHSIRWGGRPYRSDVFRTVIEREYPGDNLLYADLDVYFAAASEEWSFDRSFTYRGGETWGNTAILFLHREREKLSREFDHSLVSGVPALPWHFFSDERCAKYGISVLPCDRFDPGWTSVSVSFEHSEWFLGASTVTEDFIAEIQKENLAVHWHNQWSTPPASVSPFRHFLDLELAALARLSQEDEKPCLSEPDA
jgi:hypothetical protein